MNTEKFKSDIFISGIGTGVGKTMISALFAAAGFDYWKPVQAGDLDRSDSISVASLVPSVKIHPEAYRLNSAFSPHAAAKMDGVTIELNKITRPRSENAVVVEGAGGLMAPLNDKQTVIDLIEALRLPVILVIKHYLGGINHSLLSLEALRTRKIPVVGLVFNGAQNAASENAITSIGGVKTLFRFTSLTTGFEQGENSDASSGYTSEENLNRQNLQNLFAQNSPPYIELIQKNMNAWLDDLPSYGSPNRS